jgi:hypothetical protein
LALVGAEVVVLVDYCEDSCYCFESERHTKHLGGFGRLKMKGRQRGEYKLVVLFSESD